MPVVASLTRHLEILNLAPSPLEKYQRLLQCILTQSLAVSPVLGLQHIAVERLGLVPHLAIQSISAGQKLYQAYSRALLG